VIGGRYTLDRQIGRGGMGSVWLGRDEVLGRPVALKRIGVAPGASSPDLLRAEREARIAASLNHPNIVGVFDLVDDGDQRYLVMEYVDGRTLADLVRDRGALPVREAARILAQVAGALTAAHAQHVVHRDVKPSNILVRADGEAKLSDFGIARSEADESLTQTGLVTGSPAYLSPEVASGKLATTASDVWSLGATLFHALAGRPPYDVGDNVLGALYQIVNEPPPRLETAGELGPVLLATMSHDPQRRWAMADVAQALELVAADADPAAVAAAGPRTAPVGLPRLPQDEPATQRLPLGAAPATPTPATPSTERATPLPARSGSRVDEERRRRTPVVPILVGVVILVLLGIIGVLVMLDDPQSPDAAPGTDQTGTSAPAPSPSPSSPSSEPPSSEPTTDEPVTAQEIEDFATGYVATATADVRAGFQQLTPEFQAESGGLSGYRGFWGDVSSARILEVRGDPRTLTVTYTYTYVKAGTQRTEPVRLQLEQVGDQLLIAGEA
jgi:eukaryotic-like serine/threonine-protein kinase